MAPKKEKRAEEKKRAEVVEAGERPHPRIGDLEDQLRRYQQKCHELEVRGMDFSSRYSALEKEERDIVEYLKRSLSQKEEELDGLTETLWRLQQDKDLEREALELRLRELGQESQVQIHKLSLENVALAEKLAGLELFQEQRERLMFDLASLEEQLANQKEEHSAAVYELEKKVVLDKDRLKKEMQVHVAAVAEELQKASERNMSDTTVRVTQENAHMRTQLGRLVLRCQVLTEDNEALRSRQRQLQMDIEVLEPLARGIGRKNQSNQKVAQQLTEKCRQLQSELVSHSSTLQGHQQLQTQHTLLQAEMDALRRDHGQVREECRRSAAEEERLVVELKEERERRSQLERTLQEAAFTLQQELEEGPKGPEEEEDDTPVRRNLMQQLLLLLDGGSQLRPGLAGTDLVCTPNRQRPAPGRAAIQSSGTHLSPLQTGDLGLVPLQKANTAAMPSKVAALTGTARLGLARPPPPPSGAPPRPPRSPKPDAK